MGYGVAATIPAIPLSKGSVLLPGTTIRVPVSKRPDIRQLLSSAFTLAAQLRSGSALTVGCIPLNSPFLSRDGRHLLDPENGDGGRRQLQLDVDPGKASEQDLYMYGTLGKIIGVQGQANLEPYLLIQGIRRFRLDHVVKEKPYFEIEVTSYEDEGK